MTAQPTQLSEELQQQLDHINGELSGFLESELYHQGLSRLDQILASVPDDDTYRVLRGALMSRRAELLLELEDDEEAWECAQKAMNAGWYDASVHAIAGWAMYNLGESDKALEQFDRALAMDPERVSCLNGRALVYMENEEWDHARTDLSRVLQLDPEYAAAYGMRAEIGIHVGTINTAVRDIEKARELAPEDPDLALLHARLLTAQGTPMAALEVLDGDVLAEDGVSLEALLLRAQLRMMAGDMDGARKDAIRASNAYPDEAFAFVVLASIQLGQNSAALALKAADRAVELDPSLPDAYMMRQAAHRARGDEEAARADFERAADEPVELFMFLLGPCYELADTSPFAQGVRDILDQSFAESAQNDDQPSPDAQFPPPGGIPGLGGFGGLGGPGPFGVDPMKMLGQVFDDQGNVRPAFKPILRMAMKNAPALLKTVPPSMLQNMGNIDQEQIENFDPSQLSEEELEAQLRLFYKMVQSGQNPLDTPED